ncbi:hypothetical protein A0H81_07029 [Grifola frondosa]|uniref:Uncharacterized protein n=1 Tax=Grifola frondosa TaxID=5627 RepID=A0A1C7M7L4_GRIFR|nr:hypothetical protein A0H81_07029 [Grifola frondosa]
MIPSSEESFRYNIVHSLKAPAFPLRICPPLVSRCRVVSLTQSLVFHPFFALPYSSYVFKSDVRRFLQLSLFAFRSGT